MQLLRDNNKNLEVVNSSLLSNLEAKEQEVVSPRLTHQLALRKALESLR